jgi:hypothetical protein
MKYIFTFLIYLASSYQVLSFGQINKNTIHEFNSGPKSHLVYEAKSGEQWTILSIYRSANNENELCLDVKLPNQEIITKKYNLSSFLNNPEYPANPARSLELFLRSYKSDKKLVIIPSGSNFKLRIGTEYFILTNVLPELKANEEKTSTQIMEDVIKGEKRYATISHSMIGIVINILYDEHKFRAGESIADEVNDFQVSELRKQFPGLDVRVINASSYWQVEHQLLTLVKEDEEIQVISFLTHGCSKINSDGTISRYINFGDMKFDLNLSSHLAYLSKLFKKFSKNPKFIFSSCKLMEEGTDLQKMDDAKKILNAFNCPTGSLYMNEDFGAETLAVYRKWHIGKDFHSSISQFLVSAHPIGPLILICLDWILNDGVLFRVSPQETKMFGDRHQNALSNCESLGEQDNEGPRAKIVYDLKTTDKETDETTTSDNSSEMRSNSKK